MSELPSLRSSDDTTRPVCIRPGAFSFLVKFKRLCFLSSSSSLFSSARMSCFSLHDLPSSPASPSVSPP
jgi:hypothetical protein